MITTVTLNASIDKAYRIVARLSDLYQEGK